MSVVVENLGKFFGTQKAVDNVSFSAKPGEILGFLGPNGAGKSTTMKIATSYLAPDEGTVFICDEDVREKSLATRKKIGYLPEHNPLYLEMYVKEYLEFVASLHQIKGQSRQKRIAEMITLCGLTVEQNKQIEALSKGYRQRLGLAQALLHDPEVLILDEPTTGLDPNQIVEIRNVIKNVSQNKTVIFSTHIMQEVQALCDRVIIINQGQMVADDKIETLTKNKSDQVIIVAEFSGPIELQSLQNIEGVESVTSQELNKARIIARSGNDIRSAIFKLAAEKNWPLIGLSQEEQTMEHIFQQLTKKKM